MRTWPRGSSNVVVASLFMSAVAVVACSSSHDADGGDASVVADAGAHPMDAGTDGSARGDDDAGSTTSDAGVTMMGGDDAGAGSDGATPSDAGDVAGVTSGPVPFSATGPWRTKLPSTVPLASNSAAVIAQIQSDIATHQNIWTINTDTYSSPYFVVPADAPTQNWTWSNCQHSSSPAYAPFAAALLNVPSPPELLASMGTDEEIAIYSPSTDTYWDFWQAARDSNGQWSACFGGSIPHASMDPGYYTNGCGATGPGLPLGGFLIRIAELQAGLIEHALNIAVPHTQATNFSWPATRTDGNTAGSQYPMEGQHFRLDPTFDVSTLTNSTARVIAKALQDYGFFLTDTGGSVATQAEDPRPYMATHGGVNPYTALWGDKTEYDVLSEIPTSRLQALPQDYGKP